MNELIINNEIIKFENPTQVVNMGGPWVGDLWIGNTVVMDEVIMNNLVYSSQLHKLFFIKYNIKSRWQKDNYFTIHYLNTLNKTVFVYKEGFKKVYIDKVIDKSTLVIYNSFNNCDLRLKAILPIEADDFVEIKKS